LLSKQQAQHVHILAALVRLAGNESLLLKMLAEQPTIDLEPGNPKE
jgi:hypothetical protein